MKHFKSMVFIVAITMNAYPCLIRTIINNSSTTDMLLSRVHIKGMKSTEKGVVIRHRPENADSPRVVNAHDLGIGESLEIVVTERSSYGVICKDYRIKPNDQQEKLLLQKKDSCQRGQLTYETILELPMDPDDCFIDIYLEGNANSLTIRTMTGNDISVHYPKDPTL